MKKNRRHNYHQIKGNLSYTFNEIAQKLNFHLRTIQQWKKCGLKIIDENSRPYLVLGPELKRFLKQKSAGRKHKLSDTEFFCMKCRLPRKSKPEMIQLEYNGKIIGKNQKQVIISGLCKECNSRLIRFSTESKSEEFRKLSMLSMQRDIILPDNIHAFSNTDIKK